MSLEQRWCLGAGVFRWSKCRDQFVGMIKHNGPMRYATLRVFLGTIRGVPMREIFRCVFLDTARYVYCAHLDTVRHLWTCAFRRRVMCVVARIDIARCKPLDKARYVHTFWNWVFYFYCDYHCSLMFLRSFLLSSSLLSLAILSELFGVESLLWEIV